MPAVSPRATLRKDMKLTPHLPHSPFTTSAGMPAPRDRRGQREIVLVVCAYLAYFGVRGVTEGAVPRAMTNALGVMHLERLLGINVEGSVQALVHGSRALVALVNGVYIWGYLPVLIVGGVLLFRFSPAHYYRLRNVCLLSGALGLLVFALFPPWRRRGSRRQGYRTRSPTTPRPTVGCFSPSIVNEYAAMPSFHVGWTFMLGIELFRATRHLALRALAVAMPCAMAFAVIATANHYVLDVLAGAAAVGLALLLITLRERRRTRAFARTSGVEQAVVERVADELGARGAADLLLDVRAVGLHGAGGEEELARRSRCWCGRARSGAGPRARGR